MNSPMLGRTSVSRPIEHKRPLPDLGRAAGRRGRKQDIDVAKERERFALKPVAEFLRLHAPGAGKHRAGDQPISNVGIKIASARAEPFEMRGRGFNHGDQIGGRTRLIGSIEFDDAVSLQGARDPVDGGKCARFA